MDLRFAIRSLFKSPGFTLLAITVMALGIGANTAVFSVVNAVLLKPLDYREPDRIVTVSTLWKKRGTHGQVSAPDFHDWHDQSTAFANMASYNSWETAVVTGNTAEYLTVADVTAEFLRVFQVEPIAGRFFSTEEQKPGGSGAVMVSCAYWQTRLGGNRAVIGQTLRMFDKALPIVGILPCGFHFPAKTDIWFPANTIFADTTSRSAHNYKVIARLKRDVSLEQAQSQMTAIGTRLEKQYPSTNEGKNVAVTRMRDEMVTNIRLTLYLLLGAVGLLLLIACANMANLLLAKATVRTREIAIRAAVGASRGRIVRQLTIESLVLALLSGIAGVLLAVWGSAALVALAPSNVPRLAETGIDGWVLAFTLVISILSSLLFGLAPALHSSRVDLNDALKQGSGRALVGGTAGRIRSALVVAEIALSVILLAGAGLLLKSFVALHNVALGFNPEHVIVMQTSVPASDLAGERRATRLYKDLLAEVASIPGVTSAGATMSPPGIVYSDGGYFIDRLPEIPSVSSPQAVFSVVTPNTLPVLGIPIKSGRDFNPGDTYEAPFTAIINQALAKQSFNNQDPIGHMIFCGLDSPKAMKIVGVVGDIHQSGPARPPSPEIYMPYEQHPGYATALNVLVRTSMPLSALSPVLQRKVRDRSPNIPVKFSTLEETISTNVAAPRFRTLLLGIFASLAVVLAMAGVYGVMAYVVGQRSSEIGLRMALGASGGDVLRLVLRQGMMLAAFGLVIGLAGAMAASRLMTSMLFEVKPNDPLIYACVTVLFAAVALVASYLPARRASRVDPLVALRVD